MSFYQTKNEQVCVDCGGTDFVEDFTAGDLICSDCGLVCESHIIDQRSEWRTFADKDKDSVDPNRVGGPENPLLGDSGLSTVIGRSKNGDDGGLAHALNRTHARSNGADRTMLTASRVIKEKCDMLSLVGSIHTEALSLYKKGLDMKSIKGRGLEAICLACIVFSCKQANNPRSFNEVCAVGNGLSKKEIGKIYKLIKEEFKHSGNGDDMARVMGMSSQNTHPSKFIRRFGSALCDRLQNQAMQAAEDFTRAAKPADDAKDMVDMPWHGKPATTIAAVAIYVICKIRALKTGEDTPLSEISKVSGVAEGTIKSTYTLMYEHMSEMFKNIKWASPKEVAALPSDLTVANQPKDGKGGKGGSKK